MPALTSIPPIITLRTRPVVPAGPGLWAIGLPSGEWNFDVTSGVVPAQASPEETRADAVIAAFKALLERTASLGPIHLDVTESLKPAIVSILGAFPGIRLSSRVASAAQRAAVNAELYALSARFPAPEPQPLLIATDASIGRGGRTAGLGWVVATEGGQVVACGHDTVEVSSPGDIVLGELAAMRAGILAAKATGMLPKKKGKLTVLSDSKPALHMIDLLRQSQDGTLTAGTKAQRAATIAALAGTSKHTVVFEWVKAHEGHRLNEAADRLAVLARRNKEFRVPGETGSKMVQDIQQELRAAA